MALKSVGSIEQEIGKADELIKEAKRALEGANKNANEAKKNAQEAQQKFAEQASKVSRTRDNDGLNISFLKFSHHLDVKSFLSSWFESCLSIIFSSF